MMTRKFLSLSTSVCLVAATLITAACKSNDQVSADMQAQNVSYEQMAGAAPAVNPYTDTQMGYQGDVASAPAYEPQIVIDDQAQYNPVPVDNNTAAPSCHLVKNGQVVPEFSADELVVVDVNEQAMPQNATVVAAKPASTSKSTYQQIKLGRTEPMSSYVNIETPVRCEIPATRDVLTNLVHLTADSFKMTRLERSDDLPRYEVNGYTFKNLPLDVAIQNLVLEAGIRVYADDALFPEVSGDKIRGELTAVLNELTAAGDIYYRYNAVRKQLFLSRYARFTMNVPGGRVGMYAVLDALRGANITNVQPDFGANEIYMRLNRNTQKTVLRLVDTFINNPDMVLFDVQVYRFIPQSSMNNADWQQIVQSFGVRKINTSVSGIMGRLITMGRQPNHKTLVDSLRRYGAVQLISEGMAVMPNGWNVRFDVGQCSKFDTPEKELSMVFQSNILKNKRVETNISLDTPEGEITSFHTLYNIDDSLNIIGIPGYVFNEAWENNGIEYIIVMRPRLVQMVK